MSIIYERLKTNITNKICYDEYNGTQFQFLVDNCVTVSTIENVWLMFGSAGVCDDGWVNYMYDITIYKNGNVFVYR